MSVNPSDPAVVADLSRRFHSFARKECAGYSPLYEAICHGIADDPALLGLAAGARPGQPVPNILLGAVKFLLLQGASPGHRLHAVFSAADDEAGGNIPADAFEAWRDFALANADAVRLQVAFRHVQTNEVGRCAVLAQAYTLVADRAGRPLALVEAGCSAGLNLLFPHYRHEYRTERMLVSVGPDDAAVDTVCELRGPYLPPLIRGLRELPELASAVGVDLIPVDATDPDQRLWLQALVWPGHPARERRLVAALDLARRTGPGAPRIVAGNILTWLPRLDELTSPDGAVVVSHSFVVNQFTPLERDTFDERLQAAAASRDAIWRVGFEHLGRGTLLGELWLTTYRDGQPPQREHLADAHPHGLWLEWLTH